MSIAAMAVWIITVIIGAYLLAAGITNEHRQAAEAAARHGPDAAPELGASDRPAAVQAPAAGRVPAAATGEAAAGHPLLEFCHPALAVIGLMLWIFFVVSGHSAFAWIAFGTLAVTALAGITWLISGIEHRRRARVPSTPVFPRHLALLHGLAVTCTFTLVLIAAAGHG